MGRFLSDSGKCGYDRYLEDHRTKSGEIESSKIDAVIGYIENCATSIKYAIED